MWLCLGFLAQSVEALKSWRETVVKQRSCKLPDTGYFSNWEVRRQESNEFPHSWVGSILWITHTHTNAHVVVMNYRALSLKPWPRTSSHDTSIHHFMRDIDPTTAIWHKCMRNGMQHDIFHHLLPFSSYGNPPENRSHNQHHYVDQSKQNVLCPLLFPKVLSCEGFFGHSVLLKADYKQNEQFENTSLFWTVAHINPSSVSHIIHCWFWVSTSFVSSQRG